MRFVHKNHTPRQFMESPECRRSVGRHCFKEGNRRCHNNRRAPERGQIPGIHVLKVCPAMQLGNDFSRVFSRQNQRFAVNINRLLNDTGVRQDHKDLSGLPPDRLPQQVRHDSRRLAGANRAVTGSKAVCNFRVTAGCIHLPAQCTSRVIAAKHRNIPIQRSQPFFRPERRHLLLLRRLLIGSCRVRMVGVRKAGQRHAKEHALLPRIGLDQLRRHQIRNTCSVPLQQLCKCLVCVLSAGSLFVTEHQLHSVPLLRKIRKTFMMGKDQQRSI